MHIHVDSNCTMMFLFHVRACGRSRVFSAFVIHRFNAQITIQWSDHNSVVKSRFSGQITIQWSNHDSMLKSQFSAQITIQWSNHNSMLKSQFSGQITIRWSNHNSVVKLSNCLHADRGPQGSGLCKICLF